MARPWEQGGCSRLPAMRRILRPLAVSVFLSLPSLYGFGNSPAAKHDPVVRVSTGSLRGSVEQGAGSVPLAVFRGIPYAKPPVGDLRWAPPQTAVSWSGDRAATAFGPPCAQQRQGWNDRFVGLQSEDCLYLNLWSPALPTDANPHPSLPVMVYIHGGSNQAGTASEELSNGLALAPRGVVLVTLNYRLGVFGFLSDPALKTESGAGGSSGNYGLRDQIAALTWVQREISHFGGDPKRVTILGQSAGSIDVGALMASSRARGLFARAIEESGTVLGLLPPVTAAASEQAWAGVRTVLGGSVRSMRQRATAEVLQAEAGNASAPRSGRGLSIDGWVLSEPPEVVFASGKEAHLPLLIGNNVQEIVPAHESPQELRTAIEARLSLVDARRLEAIYGLDRAAGSPESTDGTASTLLGDASARWATDSLLRCPSRAIAHLHATHGDPTYEYQFDVPLPWQKTAMHSTELFFLFHYFHAQHGEAGTWTAEDEDASDALEHYWTNFAKTGDPNLPDRAALPAWPRFVDGGEAFLEFTDGGPVIGERLHEASCSLINAAMQPAAPASRSAP